ncbi:RDD family protein [Microbacterium marinilacus]|uniref:RDD family protein n=1 Tax=Microbacterium marinilacus TaxID=415209 RepID=A0ABP7BJ12_9MICO|nr:RDD family protein [Microbacterium marinilacus]MBY0688461.1 RDD family protein [Microbacterium marinilacus]
MTTTGAEYSYPGQRMGLPEAGSGSIARVPRRLAALAIDWLAAVIISVAFFDYDAIATMVVFAVVQILFIPTIGGSPGHRIAGLRLRLQTGGWTGVWRPIVRTLLLVVVIPAVIWDPDQRGLHDRAAGLVLVRA